MAADIIQANYEQLETIASLFQKQADLIQQLTQRVNRAADALQEEGWQGEGIDAFAREMDGDVFPALKRLEQALTEAQQVTLQVSATVKSAEEEAERLFRVNGDRSVYPESGSNAAGGISDDDSLGRDRAPGNNEYGGDQRHPTVRDSVEMEGISGRSGSWEWGSPREDDRTDFSAIAYEREFFNVGDSVWSNRYDFGRYGNVDVSLLGYGADSSVSLGFDDDGLEIDGRVNAEAYLAQVGYRGDYGRLDIEAEAQVGAKGFAAGQLEFNPLEGDAELEAGVEVFVGAEAEGQARLDLHWLRVIGTGRVGVGAGAEAHIETGFDDGVFGFDAGAGLIWGVGGGVGTRFEVDIPQIVDDVVNVGGAITDSIGSIFD